MKHKFFSRITATALTLAMLLPWTMTAPVSAAGEKDSAVTTIWSFTPELTEEGREKFAFDLFPNNLVLDLTKKTTNTNYPYYFTCASEYFTRDGLSTLSAQALHGSIMPSVSSSSIRKYTKFNGTPYKILEGGEVKRMENLKFELGGVDYPINTKGMGALNIAFDHVAGTGVMDLTTANELTVHVSLDGKTWLEDTVGIRSVKLIGGGITDGQSRSKGSEVVVFHVETESLLDIEGLKPGDKIQNIKIHVLDDDSSQGANLTLASLELNAYDTVEDFDRLAPREEQKYVHVGEDTMRQIVADEGARTANIIWTTDTNVFTITGKHYMQHLPGFEFRGAPYTQTADASRELLESQIVDGKWMGGYGEDNAYGMDCQNFVYNAVCRVSPAMGWACQYTMGQPGLTLLGEDFLNIPESIVTYTDVNLVNHNTQQDMFKSYALAKKGDQMVNYDTKQGGHVRVVTENHVVYNPDGTINGAESKMITTQQAMYPYYNVLLPDGTEERVETPGNNGYQTLMKFLEEHPGSTVLYGHASMAGYMPNSEPHTYNSLYNSTYAIYTNDLYESGNIILEDVEIILGSKSATLPIEKAGVGIPFASNYCYIGYDVLLEDISTGEKIFEYNYLYNKNNDRSRGFYSSEELDNKLLGLTNGTYRLSFTLHSGPFTALGQDTVPATTESYEFTITDRAPSAQLSLKAPASATKGQTVEVLVNTNTAVDAADVDVKFDAGALTFVSAAQNDALFVEDSKGFVNILAVDAGVSAGGTLAKLTFTANSDIAALSDVIQLKSAMVSTAGAAGNDAVKAIDGTQVCASINFGDVSKNAWYHDAVDFVAANNIMVGCSTSAFVPDATLSRAMMAQIIYNAEKKPSTGNANTHTDVSAEDWFFNAARWIANENIMVGHDASTFAPNATISVEEIAVTLWNYAGKPAAANTSSAASLGVCSDWAVNGLCWAVENGILSNVPVSTVTNAATRAQAAQMLFNYLSK